MKAPEMPKGLGTLGDQLSPLRDWPPDVKGGLPRLSGSKLSGNSGEDAETVDEESLDERQPGEGSVSVDGAEIELLAETGGTETGDFVTASVRDPARKPEDVVNAHRGENGVSTVEVD